MNSGLFQVKLDKLVEKIGEDKATLILSNFCCPLNEDVEQFIKKNAIEFGKQGIAQTQLVFASYRGKPVLVGYYTLASNKYITVGDSKKFKLSNSQKKRINKFGTYDKNLKKYVMSVPLIAQLGLNYAENLADLKLLRGDQLLKLALEKVSEAQQIIGGRWVYLECEDKPKLKEFYEGNGFVCFGLRKLDADETKVLEGGYLLQYLKYLH